MSFNYPTIESSYDSYDQYMPSYQSSDDFISQYLYDFEQP
jgi:hypothetical protein